MNKIENVKDLEHVLYAVERLKKIAHTLHALNEGDCNGRSEQGAKQSETRQKHLLADAQKIADIMGLTVFHQGDPRGPSLFLCEKKDANQAGYTKGVSV